MVPMIKLAMTIKGVVMRDNKLRRGESGDVGGPYFMTIGSKGMPYAG
jgi:hypothetical protein